MTSLAIGNSVIINNVDLHVNDTDLASKIYLIPPSANQFLPSPGCLGCWLFKDYSDFVYSLFTVALIVCVLEKGLRWVLFVECFCDQF